MARLSRIFVAFTLLLLITLIGVAGYMIIEGMQLLDALYMTVITVSTVGFREVNELSSGGRLFTVLLIVTSFGTFAYAVSAVTVYVVEGDFQRFFKDKKVNRDISQLNKHVVICGMGRNGRQAAQQLRAAGHSYVVIEQTDHMVSVIREGHEHLFIEGDATHDDVLEKARVAYAKALITTLPKDADNLLVVLTAREMNPDMTIISRASEESSDKKLRRAGADNVIMPDKIGGAHMASLVLKPDVIEFIDYIIGQYALDTNLEEISFDHLPENLRNKSIRDLEVRNRSGANIVGFRTAEGQFVINPSPDTPISPNAKVFVLGTPEQVGKLKEIFSIT
ncbi:MAG: potassium channel protein [Flavobacteriales bacterium]|nr:potassium channel protein [Flavobacteriales bacterium]MCB9447445.1 potassium channel protein [Flavobacteriales bacterium]